MRSEGWMNEKSLRNQVFIKPCAELIKTGKYRNGNDGDANRLQLRGRYRGTNWQARGQVVPNGRLVLKQCPLQSDGSE
jgi:hypothetical protein